VSHEEGLVDGHVLAPDRAAVALALQPAVDEQERIPMREQSRDLADVHGGGRRGPAGPLLILELDDLEIELNGPELPSLDGSALPWFEALQRAGAAELKAPRKTLELLRPVSVEFEGATLTAMPSERPGLHLSYTLDYSGHGLPPQYVEAHVPGSDLAAEVAPARTFVFASEADALQKSGLGQGAHGGNTVVLAFWNADIPC